MPRELRERVIVSEQPCRAVPERERRRHGSDGGVVVDGCGGEGGTAQRWALAPPFGRAWLAPPTVRLVVVEPGLHLQPRDRWWLSLACTSNRATGGG